MERQRNNTSTAAAAPHTFERGKVCALNCQSYRGRITVITTTKEGSVFNRASGFLFRSIYSYQGFKISLLFLLQIFYKENKTFVFT